MNISCAQSDIKIVKNVEYMTFVNKVKSKITSCKTHRFHLWIPLSSFFHIMFYHLSLFVISCSQSLSAPLLKLFALSFSRMIWFFRSDELSVLVFSSHSFSLKQHSCVSEQLFSYDGSSVCKQSFNITSSYSDKKYLIKLWQENLI